jgi:CubicO group peptidase (beta-lactamase class C family)
MDYAPSSHDWQARPPGELDHDGDGLADAIAYHRAHETPWRPDFLTASGRYIGVADEPPAADDVLGPVQPRGGPNGVILRRGSIVAEWGDTSRVDMTFSVAKSYLAVLAGLAVGRRLVRSIDDPVRDYALDDGFASAQNRDVTWRHLLQQTSEWQGTVWGKPDTIDHNRDVGKSELGAADKGTPRELRSPGTVWEYNDVRVNRLSLSLLQVFREPLPDVLRATVMQPIGASSTWRWMPYRNSWTTIDGARLPSVPGGSHWGGGLWMSTRDHARFALLVSRRGRWGDRQLIPASWIDELRRPCALNPEYGLLWWLNTGRRQFPGAPESSYAARGAGSNVLWIDPEHDLVAVVRWIDKPHVAPFIERVVASVRA